jgi:pyruvate, water dikinase
VDKLYWLEQIQQKDHMLVGDKAFYLSKILQRGYPVVPGFVISADVFREFLETLNKQEALVADLPNSYLRFDVNNWRQLQQIATKLREEVNAAVLPNEWINKIYKAAQKWDNNCLIFRASVTISNTNKLVTNTFGLLESHICPCEPEAITTNLKKIWGQLFRAKNLLYWQRNDIELQDINLAILIQPLKDASASGVLWSHLSEYEIEATWGLGISIVQGHVSPDLYKLQRNNGKLIQQHLGNKMLAYGLNLDLQEIVIEETNQQTNKIVTDNNCITSYILEEFQQLQQTLSASDLQLLFQLAHRLTDDLGATFRIEWVISKVHQEQELELLITQVNSEYLQRENITELRGIAAATGEIIGRAYVIYDGSTPPQTLPDGVILVISSLNNNWLHLLKKPVGIITEKGGITSHAAILARELGIPAVVNVSKATSTIHTGETLFLNGDTGEISRIAIEEAEKLESNFEKDKQVVISPTSPLQSVPISHSRFSSMIGTQLFVNFSQSTLIEEINSLPVDGLGLLRSELMILRILEGQNPDIWINSGRISVLQQRWFEEILLFARAFAPRPVFYRSLDWRLAELDAGGVSQEFSNTSDTSGTNSQSMLGKRGTFSYMSNSTLFDLELAALLMVQQAGYNNIRLILPFVRTVEEFAFCQQKVEDIGLTKTSQFQLWIMAEVPSVILLFSDFLKAGVQGISIGTNDLTQLLLGVDRDFGELARAFDEQHPAVMKAIEKLIKMAIQGGIPCSICGQAPVLYPEIIDSLVRWGITSISVEPEAVERTYQAIARAEQRLLLDAARNNLQN